jgi:hypothetical protein
MRKPPRREILLWLNDSIHNALDLNYSVEDIASVLQVSKKEIHKIQDSRSQIIEFGHPAALPIAVDAE